VFDVIINPSVKAGIVLQKLVFARQIIYAKYSSNLSLIRL